MQVKLELLKGEMLSVQFPYDKLLVSQIRNLSHRRWHPGQKRWEVHVAHLRELIEIFSLKKTDIDPAILDHYRKKWAKNKIRVELGVLEGRIDGVGFPLAEIDEVTSFHMPGYKFSPKFQSGKWDGKRHLFTSRTMKFPSGLWPRIREVLNEHKLEYEVEETVPLSSPSIEFVPRKTPLRPYQEESVHRAIQASRGIIQIATGGGKTLLAAHLIARLGRPALFFVHTRELLYQAAGVLRRELGTEIGLLGDGNADLRDVTVATIQTAARALGLTVGRESTRSDGDEDAIPTERETALENRRDAVMDAIGRAEVVIFDECHHVPAETFYKIALKTPGAVFRFGLSATPWRDDGHDLLLEAALGAKICTISCTDLIKMDFLVAPLIRFVKAPSPQIRGPGRLEYADLYRAAIVENLSRNRVIAAQAQEWAAQGMSVLILVAYVEHGRNLQALLPQAQFVHGSLDTDQRRGLINDLERKLHPILIATTLADEGLDIPNLDALILAGGGKSETKAYQRIGRTLRPVKGKSEARVLDFMDAISPLKEHSMARLQIYRHEPGFKIQMDTNKA